MGAGDLEWVALCATTLSGIPVSATTLVERLGISPNGSLIAQDGSEIMAFTFSVPSTAGMPPKQQGAPAELPLNPDCLFVTEFQVMPRFRGLGLAGSAVRAWSQLARRESLDVIELIALPDMRSLWQRHGFSKVRQFGPLRPGPISRGAPKIVRRTGIKRRATWSESTAPATENPLWSYEKAACLMRRHIL